MADVWICFPFFYNELFVEQFSLSLFLCLFLVLFLHCNCSFFFISFFSTVYLSSFWFILYTQNVHIPARIVRNPGKLYGGLLNVSHMGYYSADEQFLNISFKETTIIRRMNVHGIKVRAMVVVSISAEKNKVKPNVPNHCTFHHMVQQQPEQLWRRVEKIDEETLQNHSLPLRIILCFTPVLL